MTITVQIEVDGQKLYRNYGDDDGQLPESAKEGLQEMFDTIQESKKLESIDGLSGEEERKAVNAVRYDQPLVDDDTHLQYYENVIAPHNKEMQFRRDEAYQANTD